ncbi:MAG: DUF2281 domain-containing protein [Chitinophagales bacterium]
MTISSEILHKLENLSSKQQLELEIYLSKLQQQHTDKLIPFGDLFGILKGKIQLSNDFDEPLDEFKDYM